MKNVKRNLNVSEKELKILKELDKKQNGSYFRIQYLTDCNSRVSANWKGHNVSKLTTLSVRKGIKYDNLKSVITKRMKPDYVPSIRKSYYFHIDNMLCKHNDKAQYYVALYPNIFGKPKTIYMLDGIPKSKQYLIDNGVMQPSFWKHQEKKPEMITLGLDKIINVY